MADGSTRGAGPLDGLTVLDLSTVGPGTRCTRILADYGARLVKVGAPPRKSGVQVEPRFYAYSAQRGALPLHERCECPRERLAL